MLYRNAYKWLFYALCFGIFNFLASHFKFSLSYYYILFSGVYILGIFAFGYLQKRGYFGTIATNLAKFSAILWFITALNFDDYPHENKPLITIAIAICGFLYSLYLIKSEYLKSGLLLIFAIAIILYAKLVGDYFGTSLLFLAFGVSTLLIRRKNEK